MMILSVDHCILTLGGILSGHLLFSLSNAYRINHRYADGHDCPWCYGSSVDILAQAIRPTTRPNLPNFFDNNIPDPSFMTVGRVCENGKQGCFKTWGLLGRRRQCVRFTAKPADRRGQRLCGAQLFYSIYFQHLRRRVSRSIR